jgi:hypothetical protein
MSSASISRRPPSSHSAPARLIRRVRKNPRPFVIAGVGIAFVVGFFAIVAPLFTTGGARTAELAGTIPAVVQVSGPLEIDLGLDNTGTALIDPVCIRASISGPLEADHAVFQGLDDVPFRSGSACGGALSGQDTISVKLFLHPSGSGLARVSLVPAQGAMAVGPPLAGTIRLVKP